MSLRLDPTGRPILELYVGVSTSESSFRPAFVPIPVRGLIDTGASRTVVSRWVVDRLGLSPVGMVKFRSASSEPTLSVVETYSVDLELNAESVGHLATDLEVLAVRDLLGGSGIDLLVGRDLLGNGLFTLDGLAGQFTLAIEPGDASR